MPYINEYADKTSHSDIVRNPDIQRFLSTCKPMVEPSEAQIKEIVDKFVVSNGYENALPENIIAIDGSNYEASIRQDIPSTRVGYVKIGSLLINRTKFNALDTGKKFIDPFEVSRLKENNEAITFALPSSNLKYKDSENVRDGFRLAVDEALHGIRTKSDDPKTSLRSTLFSLAAYRRDVPPSDSLIVDKCPTCGAKDVLVKDIEEQQYCKSCSNPVYASDSLRIWEEVVDSISNQSALTRFMNVAEHLFAIHYIRTIKEANPESYVDVLANLCFFIDGPLAIFGNSAKMYASIMKMLYEINQDMRMHGKNPLMMIGLKKSGVIYDYFKLINKHLPNNHIYSVEDNFRYKYIDFNKTPSDSTYGHETYYGQDFMFKTQSGRIFVFNVPYPFLDKAGDFGIQKSILSNYSNIWAYTKIIEEFETDLYENAVVPIALAHKYTAISLSPGSDVLNLLSREKVTVNT